MDFKIRVWDIVNEKMYYPFIGIADDLYLTLEGRVCSEEEEIQSDGSRLAYRGYRMTPMLHTGFSDKNGRDIYFSDLVKFDGNEAPYEVVINDFMQIPVVENDLGQMSLYKCFKAIEVVGNIYESELTGGVK